MITFHPSDAIPTTHLVTVGRHHRQKGGLFPCAQVVGVTVLNKGMKALAPDDMAMLRLGEVAELTSLSPSTIYHLIRCGSFPKPARLAPNRVGWSREIVFRWLESRVAAAATDDDQLEQPAVAVSNDDAPDVETYVGSGTSDA